MKIYFEICDNNYNYLFYRCITNSTYFLELIQEIIEKNKLCFENLIAKTTSQFDPYYNEEQVFENITKREVLAVIETIKRDSNLYCSFIGMIQKLYNNAFLVVNNSVEVDAEKYFNFGYRKLTPEQLISNIAALIILAHNQNKKIYTTSFDIKDYIRFSKSNKLEYKNQAECSLVKILKTEISKRIGDLEDSKTYILNPLKNTYIENMNNILKAKKRNWEQLISSNMPDSVYLENQLLWFLRKESYQTASDTLHCDIDLNSLTQHIVDGVYVSILATSIEEKY
jgi:hypothetical protein